MKKVYYLLIIILFFISFEVYAENYDVEAKYDVEYNVEVFRGIINNNTIQIEVNSYTLEFNSKLTNVEVIIIKAEKESNDYAKIFSQCEENYYLLFFKDGKKINNVEMKVWITNSDKSLHIYDRLGNKINSNKEQFVINGSDYFFSISTKDYKIIDPNSFIQDLENIKLNPNSAVEIYNNDGILVNESKILGTGYKVKVNNDGIINEYIIIVKGDVDSDGKMSVLDIVKVNNHIVGTNQKLDDIYVLAGDYDNDNKLSVLDIVKVNNVIVGGN